MASNRSLLIIAKFILSSYALFVIYICSTVLYHRINGSKPTHFTYLTVNVLNVFEDAPLPFILLLYWFALITIYSMIVILYNINYEKTAVLSITKHVLRGPFAETPLFPLMNVAIDWALLFGAKNDRGQNMPVPVYLGLALVTIANIWIIYDHYYNAADQRQENAQNDVEGMGQQELSCQTSKPYHRVIVSKMLQCMMIIKFLLLLVYCVFFLCVSIAIIESDFGRQYRKNFTLQSKEDVLTYRLYVASFVSLNLALIGLFSFTIFAPLCLSVHVFLIYTDILYVNRSVISPNVRIVVCGLQFIFAIMEIVSLSFAYDLYTIKKRKVAYEKANRENAQIVPNKVTKCVGCQTDCGDLH